MGSAWTNELVQMKAQITNCLDFGLICTQVNHHWNTLPVDTSLVLCLSVKIGTYRHGWICLLQKVFPDLSFQLVWSCAVLPVQKVLEKGQCQSTHCACDTWPGSRAAPLLSDGSGEDRRELQNHSVCSQNSHFLLVTLVAAFCNEQNLFVQRIVFLFGTVCGCRVNFTGIYRVVVCYGLSAPWGTYLWPSLL